MSEIEQSGGCLCGAVRFHIDQSAVVSAHHCHCRDCQRATGSAMATFAAVPDSAFTLESGEVKSFAVTGQSGGQVARAFCPECGSQLWSEVTVMPGVKFIKGGAFDDASWIKPVSSFWTGSAQPWGPPAAGIQQFETNPGA
jgi:hypothetical protein